MRRRALKKQPAGTAKSGRDTKASANETIEERAERLRVRDDLEKLRNIFIPRNRSHGTTDDVSEQPTSPDHGNLFLLQLPPLTPFLTDPTAPSIITLPVKTEPGTPTNNPTTIDLDTLPDAPSTHTNSDVKPDLNPVNAATPQPQMEGTLTATEPLRLPAGFVGKLHVHRSGKVTLDWGGTDMEVRLGSKVDFLQDVVLVQPPSARQEGVEKRDGDGDEDGDEEMVDLPGGAPGETKGKGKAFALGQVREKMVLIPDWAKLYD